MVDIDGDGKLEEQSEPGFPQTSENEKILSKNNSTKLYYNLDFPKDTLYTQYGTYKSNGKKFDGIDVSTYKEYFGIEKIAIEGDNNVSIKTVQEGTKLKRTTTDTSGYDDFKSTVFKCTEVKYNDVGRIYYMKFEAKR